MFSKHKWVVKEKQVLPSAFEQSAAAGLRMQHCDDANSVFHKPCIVTYRCELTGEEKVVRI